MKVFVPVKVKSPEPDLFKSPEPDNVPDKVWLFEELKVSVPEFDMLPAYDPLFNCPLISIVPAEIVVFPK